MQSAFLNLDAQFAPDAVLTPLVAGPAAAADGGEEDEQADVGTVGSRRWRRWRRRLRMAKGGSQRGQAMGAAGGADAGGDVASPTAADATASSSRSSNASSALDADEKKKAQEDARDRLGLALSARLEVPQADGSGWQVLYQGPPVRRVLDAPGLDATVAATDSSATSSTSSSTGHSRFLREVEAATSGVEAELEPSQSLPASVRTTPTSFRLLAVLFDTPGMERGFPVYRFVFGMCDARGALCCRAIDD